MKVCIGWGGECESEGVSLSVEYMFIPSNLLCRMSQDSFMR